MSCRPCASPCLIWAIVCPYAVRRSVIVADVRTAGQGIEYICLEIAEHPTAELRCLFEHIGIIPIGDVVAHLQHVLLCTRILCNMLWDGKTNMH